MLGAKALADQHGARLIMHKASSLEEVESEVARTGARPVEHMHRIAALGSNVYLLHAMVVSDDEVAMLAETDTKVCHSPSAALKLAKGISRYGKFLDMMKAGVTVCLGCDGSNSSDYRDMVRAVYLAATLPKDFTMKADAITAERAIEMATRDAARAIGWEDEIGSLEVGKKADIVLFDMDRPEWVPTYNVVAALVYSATGDSVETVLVDGRVIMERRRLITIDESEVRGRVQARREQFLGRAGLRVSQRWPVI
jgi:cytosine/adenosine deaminase-related metal-dependent hydrolase